MSAMLRVAARRFLSSTPRSAAGRTAGSTTFLRRATTATGVGVATSALIGVGGRFPPLYSMSASRAAVVPVAPEPPGGEDDLLAFVEKFFRAFMTLVIAAAGVAAVLAASTVTVATMPAVAAAAMLAFLTKPSRASFTEWYKVERKREAAESQDLLGRVLSHAADIIDVSNYEFVDIGLGMLVFVRTPRNNTVRVYLGALREWCFLVDYEENTNFDER